VKRRLGIVLVLLLVLLCPAFAHSSRPSILPIDVCKTGSISGTIKTPAGAPAVGLRIQLFENRQRGKLVAETVTDRNGHFEFKNIPEGTYLLKAGSKAIGFLYMEIQVRAGKNTEVGMVSLI